MPVFPFKNICLSFLFILFFQPLYWKRHLFRHATDDFIKPEILIITVYRLDIFTANSYNLYHDIHFQNIIIEILR